MVSQELREYPKYKIFDTYRSPIQLKFTNLEAVIYRFPFENFGHKSKRLDVTACLFLPCVPLDGYGYAVVTAGYSR